MAGILLTPLGFWDSGMPLKKVAVSISIPGKKAEVSNWKSGSQLCIWVRQKFSTDQSVPFFKYKSSFLWWKVTFFFIKGTFLKQKSIKMVPQFSKRNLFFTKKGPFCDQKMNFLTVSQKHTSKKGPFFSLKRDLFVFQKLTLFVTKTCSQKRYLFLLAKINKFSI